MTQNTQSFILCTCGEKIHKYYPDVSVLVDGAGNGYREFVCPTCGRIYKEFIRPVEVMQPAKEDEEDTDK